LINARRRRLVGRAEGRPLLAVAAGRDPTAIEITVSAPAEIAEIEALARRGIARVAVPVSSAAGLPAQVKTPDDVLRYGKDVIARFR